MKGTLEYLQTVQQISVEYGVLFILDEVQTLRLDTGGAQQLYDLPPDLTPMAKIMGGGRAETMDLFDPASAKALFHGGTFNGHPMVMAAGLSAMQDLKASTAAHINGLGDRLRTDIQDVAVEQGTAGHESGISGGVLLHLASDAQLLGRATDLRGLEQQLLSGLSESWTGPLARVPLACFHRDVRNGYRQSLGPLPGGLGGCEASDRGSPIRPC